MNSSLAVCLCESSPVFTSFCSLEKENREILYADRILLWTNLCTGWSSKFPTSQQSQYLNHLNWCRILSRKSIAVTSSFYSSLIRIQNLFFHSPHPKVLPYNFPTKKPQQPSPTVTTREVIDLQEDPTTEASQANWSLWRWIMARCGRETSMHALVKERRDGTGVHRGDGTFWTWGGVVWSGL